MIGGSRKLEWFATIRAGPERGTCPVPRASTRKRQRASPVTIDLTIV
jgi:hypothetical protein